MSLCYCLSLDSSPPVSCCAASPRQAQSHMMTVMLMICLYEGHPGRFWGSKNYLFCLFCPLSLMGDSLPLLIFLFPPLCPPLLPLSVFLPFSIFSPSASSISSLTCMGTGICTPKPSHQSLGFSPPPQSVPKNCTIVVTWPFLVGQSCLGSPSTQETLWMTSEAGERG